ncbi:succinylglutamate desuccinylase/aspartoacylase family protein [Thiotrichales bacterium 19S9-12]|nr:succinylglutamate desuccinylase/aspartoacylase family protein [Thiotrichales bacterium 19S9-11]MCF6812307.1 succinylglutamate desuccinylase/aspartoacylase family protein [Thiotrichales bacterium 19S9-12]
MTESLLCVGQDSYGEDLTVKVIHIKGSSQEAPSVYIQASMHADEIQGNAVIFELLEQFSSNQPLGDITIIPQCNPTGAASRVGSAHQGRFDPMNGDNWNRYYFYPKIDYNAFANEHINSTQAEYKKAFREILCEQLLKALDKPYLLTRAQFMAYQLQLFAYQADLVLDLHTDAEAINYLYSPSYAKDSAAYFQYSDVILMDNEFDGALDEASFSPWWHLQKAFSRLNREEEVLIEGYTLELGSKEKISQSLAIAQSCSIINYLAYKESVDDFSFVDKRAPSTMHHADNFKAIYSEIGGLYEWYVAPGETIKKGQVIGRVLQMSKSKSIDIISPVSGKIASINNQGALPQNSHLMNVFLVGH